MPQKRRSCKSFFRNLFILWMSFWSSGALASSGVGGSESGMRQPCHSPTVWQWMKGSYASFSHHTFLRPPAQSSTAQRGCSMSIRFNRSFRKKDPEDMIVSVTGPIQFLGLWAPSTAEAPLGSRKEPADDWWRIPRRPKSLREKNNNKLKTSPTESFWLLKPWDRRNWRWLYELEMVLPKCPNHPRLWPEPERHSYNWTMMQCAPKAESKK